jgi:glycosyltransferase involved in cell wall biosynthesis
MSEPVPGHDSRVGRHGTPVLADAVPDRQFRKPGNRSLRVALLPGTLVADGAEKQLVYMARALREVRVDVRVYCLTRGDFHEGTLRALGIPLQWVGRFRTRFLRLLSLAAALREFRPHIVQAGHFYTNLYAASVAPLYGALAIGCCRSDVFSEVRETNRLGLWSLRLPAALLVNSQGARRNAEALGVTSQRIHLLENVIDLVDFDHSMAAVSPAASGMRPVAIAVGRLVAQKAFDRFLAALAEARRSLPELRGVVVGEGPERTLLERTAETLGLLPEHVRFLGRRNDIPALLRQADMLVLSSEYEGLPNVILEAMSAGLPVITTPAGDAAQLVQDGVAGYVIPFDDVASMAACMARLARAPALRRQLGEAGRRRVEQQYSYEHLALRLLSLYGEIARRAGNRNVLSVLGAMEHRVPFATAYRSPPVS